MSSASMESFTWRLDTTKTALEGGCYTSPIFCLLGYTWLAKFYREHKSAPNNATVTLYLVDLPPTMQQITVRRRVHILETNTISDQTKVFKDSKGQGWPKNTLSTTDIQHMQYFTIQISMMLINKYQKIYGAVDSDLELDQYDHHNNSHNHCRLQSVDEHQHYKAIPMTATASTPQRSHHRHRDQSRYAQKESNEKQLATLSTKMSLLMQSVSSMQHTLNEIQSQICMHGHVQQQQQQQQRQQNVQYVQQDEERKEKAEREVLVVQQADGAAGGRVDDMYAFREWMQKTLKLPEYYQLFVEHGVDSLDVVQLVNGDTLDAIGINKIGHRMKILEQIQSLRQRTVGEIYEGITACYHQY